MTRAITLSLAGDHYDQIRGHLFPEDGKEAAVIESVKAASEIYAPVSGVVTESNAELSDQPDLVNQDAAGAGWFFTLTIADPAELADLLDQAAYDAMVAELH